MRRLLRAIAAAGLALTLLISGCAGRVSPAERQLVDLISAQHTPVASFADDGNYADLAPLRELAEQNQVFIFGEAHGIADSYDIALKLLKYLHSLGYRYLLVELDFTDADRYNDYLRTGDERLLTDLQLFRMQVFVNNENNLQFWRNVYAWNKTLPQNERISVWAFDVSHQQEQATVYLGELIRGLSDAKLSAQLVDAWQTTPATYAGLKAFTAELGRLTGDAQSPELTKLRYAVRSLKDSYAFYDYDRGNKATVVADYPTPANIRDLAMRDFFAYYWQQTDGLQRGKVFAYVGGYHAQLAATSSAGQEPLAAMLDRQFPPTVGKVATLCGVYVAGKYRAADGTVKETAGASGISKAAARLVERQIESAFALTLAPAGANANYSGYVIVRNATPASDRK